MDIDGVRIDEDRTYVIAEAGVNHNGDPDRARRLIRAAGQADADAIKFQTFRADSLVTPDADKADYQQDTTDPTESQHEMLERLELDRAAHERLQSVAAEEGITFLSTPFDRASADFLDDIGVPAVKIGSGELTNKPLLEHVAALDRPMIVSTGMGTMEEVSAALEWISDANPDVDVALLHCVSAYPTPLSAVNLRAMDAMNEAFDVPVGFSDHTTQVETPAYAAAAGATVVEKHFTLDRSLPGPDHELSLEPDELERAVSLVRDATTARGERSKRPTVDTENRKTVRKSLYAAKPIRRGEVIRKDQIDVKRPAHGLAPSRFEDVVGSTARTDVAAGDAITDEAIRSDE